MINEVKQHGIVFTLKYFNDFKLFVTEFARTDPKSSQASFKKLVNRAMCAIKCS